MNFVFNIHLLAKIALQQLCGHVCNKQTKTQTNQTKQTNKPQTPRC